MLGKVGKRVKGLLVRMYLRLPSFFSGDIFKALCLRLWINTPLWGKLFLEVLEDREVIKEGRPWLNICSIGGLSLWFVIGVMGFTKATLQRY